MGPPAKFCPSCDMKNEAAVNFCTDCGVRLAWIAAVGTKG